MSLEIKNKKGERIQYISVPAVLKVEKKRYKTTLLKPVGSKEDYFKDFKFIEKTGEWIKLNKKRKKQ